jgi:hypothetical protein
MRSRAGERDLDRRGPAVRGEHAAPGLHACGPGDSDPEQVAVERSGRAEQ